MVTPLEQSVGSSCRIIPLRLPTLKVSSVSEPKKPSQRTHTVACPVCATRIEVHTSDVGRKTRCPDCEHTFEIKKAEIKLEIPEAIIDDGDEYGLKDVTQDNDDARRKMSQRLMSQAEKEIREQAERKDLNKRTQGAFEERKPREYTVEDIEEVEKKPHESLTPIDYDPRAETVDFPLNFSAKELARDGKMLADVGLLMRWVFLSIFTSVTIYCAANAVYYGSLDQQTFSTYMYTLFGSTLSVVLGAGTITFLGSYLLFLVMTISSGLDEWDWPELGIFDRVMEALFFVLALVLTMVPFGIMVTIKVSFAWVFLFLPCVLFPIVYLSMLDQGSLMVPWSNVIVASLFKLPVKWALFYVGTLGLLAAVAFIGYAVYSMAGIERLGYISLPGGVLVVGYMLVYAIWLGRLSWEIAEVNSVYEEAGTSDKKEPASH